jgi:glutamine cyclotransferase
MRAARITTAMLLGLTFACAEAPATRQGGNEAGRAEEPPTIGYRIVATYPHDRGAFTQGLLWVDGKMYESTGQIGQSTIREVDLATGRVLRSVDIPAGLFGEGLVDWAGELRSITWQDGMGFRWDRATFRRTGEWRYAHEGWGLTRDESHIIMSDGTPVLRFLDPETMREIRRVTVTSAGQPVAQLNELEYVNGQIFANVWLTPRIARIDPATGAVTGWIDLAPLVAQTPGADSENSVLNGIAYDARGDRLFVTGKYWPRLYEIDLTTP